jgi:hypothetical protein
MEIIPATSNIAAFRARDQLTVIRTQRPRTVLTRQDLWNACYRQYKRDLGGCTASGALIKLLDTKNIDYEVLWHPEEPNRLLGLVWAPKKSLKLWRQFPNVLGCDNTYGTNFLGYPLFVGIGITNMNTTFNTIFGLIDTESRQAFDFLAQAVEKLRIRGRAGLPSIIITDKDEQQKAALAAVFPETQQQLCIFHILSNVKLHTRKDWEGPYEQDINENNTPKKVDDPDEEHAPEGLFAAFKRLLYAPTDTPFNAAQEALRARFSNHL